MQMLRRNAAANRFPFIPTFLVLFMLLLTSCTPGSQEETSRPPTASPTVEAVHAATPTPGVTEVVVSTPLEPTITPQPENAGIVVDGNCDEWPLKYRYHPAPRGMVLHGKETTIYSVLYDDGAYVCIEDPGISQPNLHMAIMFRTSTLWGNFSWSNDSGMSKMDPQAPLLDSSLAYDQDVEFHLEAYGLESLQENSKFLDLGIFMEQYADDVMGKELLFEFTGDGKPIQLVEGDNPAAAQRARASVFFRVPEDFEAKIIDPASYPAPWGIVSGGKQGFFLHLSVNQQLAHEIMLMDYDGEPICSSGDLNLHGLGGMMEGPDETALIGLVEGPDTRRVLQIDGECNITSYANLAEEESAGQVNLYNPLTFSPALGLLVTDLSDESIYQLERLDADHSTFTPLSGGFIQIASATSVGEAQILVWDMGAGRATLLDLQSKQKSSIIPAAGYHDTLDFGYDPRQPGEVFFTISQTPYLRRLSLDNWSVDVRKRSLDVCIQHPTGFVVTPEGDLLFIDESFGGLYSYHPESDETRVLSSPSNTQALDVAQDGTIYAGYNGCGSEGFIRKISPEGERTILTGLPPVVQKIKIAGDQLYVLGDWSQDSAHTEPVLLVLNLEGVLQYSVDLEHGHHLDGLSVLNNGHALACSLGENLCFEAGQSGTERHVINFNGADQHVSLSNQTQAGDLYAASGRYQGVVNGTPTVDRYLMKLDLETGSLMTLLRFPHTGSSATFSTIAAYEHERSSGLFLNVQPRPGELYHLMPECLRRLEEIAAAGMEPPLLSSLLVPRAEQEGCAIEKVAMNYPVDAWGLGSGVDALGNPYAVLASSLGYLRFSGLE